MDKSTERTKKYYDGIAQGYAELYHNEQKQKLECVLPFTKITGTVLDLGSGDGVANTVFNNNTIISLDLSLELLKLNTNATKLVATALILPLKDKSIDCVFSLSVLQDVSDLNQTLVEIKRVLKPTGRIILSILKRNTEKVQHFEKTLTSLFTIEKIIEEDKDKIFIGRY